MLCLTGKSWLSCDFLGFLSSATTSLSDCYKKAKHTLPNSHQDGSPILCGPLWLCVLYKNSNSKKNSRLAKPLELFDQRKKTDHWDPGLAMRSAASPTVCAMICKVLKLKLSAWHESNLAAFLFLDLTYFDRGHLVLVLLECHSWGRSWPHCSLTIHCASTTIHLPFPGRLRLKAVFVVVVVVFF